MFSRVDVLPLQFTFIETLQLKTRARRSYSLGIRRRNSTPNNNVLLGVRAVHYGGIISFDMDFQAREAGRCSLVAEALRSWGRLKLRASGISMLPALWPGDLLTIQSYQPEQVEPGEIVLYMRDGRFFIHRVASKSFDGMGTILITRGDCLAENDPPLSSGELLGRICEIQRAGSVFVPARKLLLSHRIVAYMLCHWSLLRRLTLRLREDLHRGDEQTEGALVEAAS
jgi:signal peptidase